jgi:hypothetical protein
VKSEAQAEKIDAKPVAERRDQGDVRPVKNNPPTASIRERTDGTDQCILEKPVHNAG